MSIKITASDYVAYYVSGGCLHATAPPWLRHEETKRSPVRIPTAKAPVSTTITTTVTGDGYSIRKQRVIGPDYPTSTFMWNPTTGRFLPPVTTNNGAHSLALFKTDTELFSSQNGERTQRAQQVNRQKMKTRLDNFDPTVIIPPAPPEKARSRQTPKCFLVKLANATNAHNKPIDKNENKAKTTLGPTAVIPRPERNKTANLWQRYRRNPEPDPPTSHYPTNISYRVYANHNPKNAKQKKTKTRNNPRLVEGDRSLLVYSPP